MAKTTKDRDHAAARPSGESGEVTVRNMYRHQPIVFHYLGGSVRLGPLETRRVSHGCLASPELTHLMSIGAVSVQDTEPAASHEDRRHHAAATPKEH